MLLFKGEKIMDRIYIYFMLDQIINEVNYIKLRYKLRKIK